MRHREGFRPPELAKETFDQGKQFVADGLTIERAKKQAEEYRLLHRLWNPELTLGKKEKEELYNRRQIIWMGAGQESQDLQKAMAALREMHEHTFYRNTSDPIEILDKKIGVKGKRILTIAGSGDFLQIFLHKHAKEIEACDLSLPGILYNELKLAALRHLEFADYERLFRIQAKSHPWFDLESYERIRGQVSEQCRTFFDTFIGFPQGNENQRSIDNSFGRERRAQLTRDENRRGVNPFLQTVGTIIKTPAAYKRMQERARQTDVKLRLRDMHAYLDEQKPAEVVYLSNIDYVVGASVAAAKRFLKKGAGSVYFSISPERATLIEETPGVLEAFHDSSEQDAGPWSVGLPKLPHNNMGKRRFFMQGDFMEETDESDTQPLPHTLLVNGFRMRILGWDSRLHFGMLVEARKGDQKSTP